MRKKIKRKFNLNQRMRDHAVQAILIFASVFLAFALNEYRMSRIEKKETQKALTAIIHEVESNLEVLERWTPFHQHVMIRTLHLIDKDSVKYLKNFSLDHLVGDSTSLMREFLTRHAWHYVNEQNINFDLQTRIDVIMVYQQQQFVERAFDRLIDFLFSRELLDDSIKEDNYFMFYQYIGDLWGQEYAMIETYKRALSRLKEQQK